MINAIKILVIDDDELILLALKKVFGLQGWKTLPAQDVEAGLKLFRAERPHLVLIDYHLPKINGIKGVQMLRKLDADVPIIVFTIDENQAVADSFLEAGANDFALKPIKAPDIISRIRLHIRLMESNQQVKEQPIGQYPKGIGKSTLDLIESCMKQINDFCTVEDIAEISGLAQQTIYRYLRYLVSIEQVSVHQYYGSQGRPKQKYHLHRNTDAH